MRIRRQQTLSANELGVVPVDLQINHRMRNRVQEILVADGVSDGPALDEANSICDGLGYMNRVMSSTGMRFRRGYDGIEVFARAGDLLETIPFDRIDEFF